MLSKAPRALPVALFLILFSVQAAALSISKESFSAQATATQPDLKLFVAKNFFDQNESIELFGTLFNVTATSGVASTFTPLANQNITINFTNSSGNLTNQYNFTTDVNGSFYSNSSFYPSATLVYAPNVSTVYTLRAGYLESGAVYFSSVSIQVGNATVQHLLLQPNKAEYAPGEAMNVTATALRGTGTQAVKVANVFVNGTVRYLNQTILQNFSCTTGSDGSCTANMTAPGSAALDTFVLEANHFLGYSLFYVTSFSVIVEVRDQEGKQIKDVFAQTESGVVRVGIRVNNTVPSSGNYNATVQITHSNGTLVQALSSLTFNANNTYTNQSTFSASTLGEGTYVVNVSATDAANNVRRVQRAWLQVRAWTLDFQKSVANSGFEYGYTTLPNRTLRFEVLPQFRANGTIITGIASTFRYDLKTPLGVTVQNASSATYNASCNVSGCYEFNLTAPSAIGTYLLSVTMTSGGVSRTQTKTLFVNGLTGTASTVDSAGLSKAVFGINEFLNINFTLKNATGVVNVTNASVISVTYENGVDSNYSQQTNLSLMNTSDAVLQWAWNASSNRLVLDVPKQGGLYSVEAYINNQSAKTSVQFFANPYDTCFSAKASASESASDYFWQFRPSDTVYMQITVTEAENAVGGNTSSITAALSNNYGRGNSCSFNSNQKQSVVNASINITQALNLEKGAAESLNLTASGCQSLSTQGHYLCTLKPNDTAWDTGKYAVEFSIRSQDGNVSDVGNAFFEAREFYVYGYTTNWINKPASNITLNIQVYEAGSGWWTSSTGLSGTASLQRVEYHGNIGEWFSSSTPFNYNTSALNSSTIANGAGTLTLNANGTPSGAWPAGYYTARIQVTTDDGRTDYGDAWFEVRNWDAWAQQVDVDTAIQYRYSNAPNQTVQLYLRITNAGEYSDNGGNSLGGNVTVRVKSIDQWTSNGRIELPRSQYTANPITVNQSSPYPGSLTYTTHILNITPATQFPTASFNVVLELNSTQNNVNLRQQGWGWFTIKAFHAEAQPVNLTTGAYQYTSRGKSAMGFNVTTAMDQRNSYQSGLSLASLINTTIVDLRLTQGVYEAGQYRSSTLSYPQNINFSPTYVNGSTKINVSKNVGNWSAGWYWGEMTLQDSAGARQNAYLWFSVEPFIIQLSYPNNRIGRSDNLTGTIAITDPGNGANMNTSTSNYTITQIREVRWTNAGQTTRNAVIYGNQSWNGSLANFTFQPPAATGKWQPSDWGWANVEVVVRDESDNSTRTQWMGFQVLSFDPQITRTSNQNIAANANVTLSVLMRQPNGSGHAAGNLTQIRYYDYSTYQSKIASFVVNGSCASWNSTGGCMLNSTYQYPNGTQIAQTLPVTVVPQSGSWPEGYNYLEFDFTDTSDASVLVRPSNNVYFNVVPPVRASYYFVNTSTMQSQYQFARTDAMGVNMYSFTDINGNALQVNVTNVEYYAGSEWREALRQYTSVPSFTVVGNLSKQIGSGSSGVISIPAPSGGWPSGSVQLRVSLVKTGNTTVSGVIKGMSVWVTS
ncbi:hypothetical protein HY572_01215 [Candidatus Micrarchaeota archaeon]|nr:hypothetical protein [Candidatus Micrarchaeota archaeon]